MLKKIFRYPLEEDEQQALIKWALYFEPKRVAPYLIHYPIGGKRDKKEAAKLKRMGSKKGVSDLFLARKNQYYGGLWIELKRQGKYFRHPSVEQMEWLDRMGQEGYMIAICSGWEEAKNVIMSYIEDIETK